MPKARFLSGSIFATALLLAISCTPSSDPPLDSARLLSTPRAKPTNTPIPALEPGQPVSMTAERLAAIDSHALAAPATAAASVESLAAYLTAPAKNDTEKTRAIYRWVTANISYDIKAYLSKQYGDTSAIGVLKSRTSVCEGYATLFGALGRAAGLDVLKVPGWAKGFGYSDTELEPRGNHAWNAVKVDGSWYLVDSTWGAGHIGSNQEFVPAYDDYFFLTPPDEFLYTHLPLASQWQLVPARITQTQFTSLPQVHPGFAQEMPISGYFLCKTELCTKIRFDV